VTIDGYLNPPPRIAAGGGRVIRLLVKFRVRVVRVSSRVRIWVKVRVRIMVRVSIRTSYFRHRLLFYMCSDPAKEHVLN